MNNIQIFVKAKETLEQIISEMDQEVTERFKNFPCYSRTFTAVFKQLFGGGDAELQLTEADYLTAGIDIVVQPPGKSCNIYRY